MNVVLLRVGIDMGCGGMYGPLFRDGSFEYIPIPDMTDDIGIDTRTYGNTSGRRGRKLVEYFPESRQEKMFAQSMHVDPEFETFTYGDPTASPKRGLRRLERGDLLVFYCGLAGWGFASKPALYLMGYFEVEYAGLASDLSREQLAGARKNFHVKHSDVFQQQQDCLVLVKGTQESRLFKKARQISAYGKDSSGRALKILAPEMQAIFGSFGGKTAIQRSAPRWIDPLFVSKAADFVRKGE